MSGKVNLVFRLCCRFNSLVKRPLFTAEALGITRFQEQCERTSIQYSGGTMIDKFKSRIRDTVASEQQTVYVDDFKNFLHLASSSQEDVDTVVNLCKRFQSQGKGARFSNFAIGPVIMRYFHLVQRPAEALQVFTNAQSEGLFLQFSSFKILMDLLFENGMYNEVLGVFDVLKEMKIGGYSYHTNCSTLALAACYKLDTKESYERGKQIVDEILNAGGVVSQKAFAFLADLAIRQNDPIQALDIYSTNSSSHYSVVNIKVLALSKLNRPEDTFPIIKRALGREDQNKRTQLGSDVLSELHEAINRVEDSVLKDELNSELQKIEKAMKEANRITDKTLAENLLAPIELKLQENPKQAWDNALRDVSFSRNRRDQRSRNNEYD
ncbi:pentatricopeptide repeat-containing protein 2, mitochondrial-like [Artemia franciscana]|uniref:pentatricopeptide repeat-containing protein 2, mitochondrial-like n=1 Tax=Artemia franciscana TaxID=6661 RepID=UPI0032DAE632